MALLTTLLTGLLAHWPLSEAAGVDRADAHGVELLTRTGTVGQGTGVGGVGNCATFDGSASNMLAKATDVNIDIGNFDWFYSCWFKLTDKAAIYIVISQAGNVTTSPGWDFFYDNASDRFKFDIFNGSGSTEEVIANSFGSPTAGVWYFGSIAYDSASQRIGIAINGGTWDWHTTAWVAAASNQPFEAGGNTFNSFWYKGSIQSVSRYNKIPSTTEIATLYGAGTAAIYPYLGGLALYSTVDTVDSGGVNIRVLVPNNYVSGGYPVVLYHHGAGETYTAVLAETFKAGVIKNLLGNGYLVAGSTAHGENWGNNASLTDMLNLYNYLAANYTLAARTIHLSQSMGGQSGLLAVSTDFVTIPNTYGWYGIFPVCNLANMHGGSYAGAIDTAYGVLNPPTYATQTAGHDPVLLAASKFDGLRMRFTASAADTVVDKTANTDAMRTLVTGHATELVLLTCVGDHGDPSHFRPLDVVAFCDRCGPIPPPPTGSQLLITDGATVISFDGTDGALLADPQPFTLAPPNLRSRVEVVPGADGGEQSGSDFDNVVESFRVNLRGGVAASRITNQNLARLFDAARKYNRPGVLPVYVKFRPDPSEPWYRSQILSGRGLWSSDALDWEWLNGEFMYALILTRRYYWEADDAAEVPLLISGESGAGTTGGRTITNDDAVGGDTGTQHNYIDIPIDAIAGDLPPAYELRMTPASGTIGAILASHELSTDFIQALLPGVSATPLSSQTSGTSHAGVFNRLTWSGAGEADIATWTMSTFQLGAMSSRWFRIVARFSNTFAYTQLYLRFKLVTPSGVVVYQGEKQLMTPARYLHELASVPLPPQLLPAGSLGVLSLVLQATNLAGGSSTVDLNYIELLCLDGYRRFSTLGTGATTSISVVDGMTNIVYSLTATGDGDLQQADWMGDGQPFKLRPGPLLTQRLRFMWRRYDLTMNITDTMTIRLYQRTRRLTI